MWQGVLSSTGLSATLPDHEGPAVPAVVEAFMMRCAMRQLKGSALISGFPFVAAVAALILASASAEAADPATGPAALRAPDPGTSCSGLVTDPGTFCLDMGRQFGSANPDIRFPNYQEVADQIARSPDAAKRAKATQYLNQARDAWAAGFHETALDLLRNAQIALY